MWPVPVSESDRFHRALGLARKRSLAPRSQAPPVLPSARPPITPPIAFQGQRTVPTVCRSREVTGGRGTGRWGRGDRVGGSPAPHLVPSPFSCPQLFPNSAERSGVISTAPCGPRSCVSAVPGLGGSSGHPRRGNSGTENRHMGKDREAQGHDRGSFGNLRTVRRYACPASPVSPPVPTPDPREERTENTRPRGSRERAAQRRALLSCPASHLLRGKNGPRQGRPSESLTPLSLNSFSR